MREVDIWEYLSEAKPFSCMSRKSRMGSRELRRSAALQGRAP